MPGLVALCLLLVSLVASAIPSTARAEARLVARGSISGAYQDLSAATAAPLENGIPGNHLGGMGSGLAWAGGTTFLALPDRGPNAQPYNSAVDDTPSYIPRFHTVSLMLAPSSAGSALPFTLTPFVLRTTLLSSATPLVYGTGVGLGVGSGAPALNRPWGHFFTGRSDGFDPSTPSMDPADARLDPESIRASRDGHSVFVSDEYGPHIYQFDRDTGRRVRVISLPAKFAIAFKSASGATEISSNLSGRVSNKGMEGLAMMPDGRALVGALQSPLIQDGGTSGSVTRFVRVDLRTGSTQEYGYPLTNVGSTKKPKYTTVSEVVAVNDHQLLVDERDGAGLGDGSLAVFKRLYLVDLAGAPDVSGVTGDASLVPLAIAKTLLVDVVETLGAAGIAPQDIPAKLEGVAFGPDLTVGGVAKHTIYLANDNDYVPLVTDGLHPLGTANPNQVFVLAIDPADLPGFVPQRFEGHGDDRDGDDRHR